MLRFRCKAIASGAKIVVRRLILLDCECLGWEGLAVLMEVPEAIAGLPAHTTTILDQE